MNPIDDVLIATDDLPHVLKYRYSIPSVEIENIIGIENHKGNWTITFDKVPTLKLVLLIAFIFENELSYDGIEAIIFNGQRFENVAGCLKDGTKGLTSLIEYISKA